MRLYNVPFSEVCWLCDEDNFAEFSNMVFGSG